MFIPINVPTGLTERTHIVSGGIKHQDFPDVGVIYTTSDSPSPEDFDTDFLLSCKVIGPDERQFTIVGGYFMERTTDGVSTTLTTTKVFGIANNPSRGFNITEGGSSTIFEDNWDHMDPDFTRFSLNERAARAEARGWTFIVDEALPNREHYPLSGRPIEMMGTCTNLMEIVEVEPRQETNESITLSFEVKVEAGTAPPLAYHWDFGDGNEMVSNSRKVSHTYAKGAEDSDCVVQVQSISQNACGNASASLDHLVIPASACADLLRIQTQILQEHETMLEVQFTAVVRDTDAAHYEWDFGDGSMPGEGKTVTHLYTKSSAAEGRVFRITVTSSGPQHCSTRSITQKVPWPPSMAGAGI